MNNLVETSNGLPSTASNGLRFDVGAALALLSLGALFAATHPFTGFSGDSQIYMGRAIADGDPTGVGLDMMFRLDGQSRFTIFPPVAAWLAAHVSLLTTAMLLVAASSVLWFSGLVVFVRAAALRRPWASLAIVIAAPAGYGGFDLLRFGESLAEPRPFAEAFVLFALAAFLANRRVLSLALLVLSVLFHPIMALAGVATICLALCIEDRRWIVAGLVGAIFVATAIWTSAPLASRLAPLDADWLRELSNRNAYLFPHAWPLKSYAWPIVQTILILVATGRAPAPLRRVLVAGLVAGASGVALSWFAGRYDPIVILVQAQTWRMWWLTAVLSAVALACIAVELGRGDAVERTALAALALAASIGSEYLASGVGLALVALAFLARPAPLRPFLTDEAARMAWLAASVVLFGLTVGDLSDIGAVRGFAQPDYTPNFMSLALGYAAPPLIFGAVAIAAFGPPRFLVGASRRLAGLAMLLSVAIAATLWNSASSYDRALGGAGRQAELARLTRARPGEVLWLFSTLEPWVWLGRPSWNAEIQGAGGVFSREIAMTYVDRGRAQIALGLRDESLVRRVSTTLKNLHPRLTRENVAAICRRPGAPAYIIAPVAKGAVLDPGLKGAFWTPPAVRVEPLLRADRIDFVRIERYAVLACADNR